MTIPSAEGFLPAASCLPCTAEEEREAVAALTRHADENVKDGDLRYLVSQSWWSNWQQYVGLISFGENEADMLPQAISRPGEIDNTKLVLEETISGSEEPELQRTLREGQDYTLVPQEVWRKLCEWYKGGPEISRKVICDNPTSKNYIVDVYPLQLKLIDERDGSERTIQISRKAKVHELHRLVCSHLSVEESKIDILDYYQKTKNKKLTNLNETLEEAQLMMDQEILMEMKAHDTWYSDLSTRSTNNELALIPLEPSTSSFSIAGGPTLSNGYSPGIGSSFSQDNFNPRDTVDGYTSFSNGTKDDTHGLSGLHNLGNTCFMNSAIQALVHTPPLVDYFLKDYSQEINTENPLGLQGELAIAFGELLRKLWSSAGRTSVAPRAFKSKLSRFAPQFSGYNQHDSQELLAFLLDGMHEDLNRVKKKPYIEAKDADGRPDDEFAEECWNYHKARNDSIIVDKFQGQYKSTLVCPDCNKISVTFDPFMYLSLPLPSTVTRMMTVTVFSGTGDALPMPYTVTVQKNGVCRDLSKALSDACCLKSSETLLLAEVYDHRIYRYLANPSETLFVIKDEDQLVAYKLPVGHEKCLRVEIFHKNVDRFFPEAQFNPRKLIGSPLVTCIPSDSTRKADIYLAASAVLVPFLRTKLHTSECAVKLNGNGPSLDAIVLTDNGASSEKDLSTSNEDEEAAADELLPFQLSLTDEKGYTRNPIDADSNRVLGTTMRLLMDWSDREHEIYDFKYLDDLPDVFKAGFLSKKTRQEAVNLFSCLDAFLKDEPLGPDDMWYCPSCKEHRQASKKLDLWRLPEILVVHLKRFSYSRFMKNKLDTFVNFPIHDLDMSKYVKHTSRGNQPRTYELYAVINHYGGLGGGHYSAYAKLVEENSWYHFDDSHVSSVNEEEIRTSAAYLLFYRCVDGNSCTLSKDVSVDTDMVDSLET